MATQDSLKRSVSAGYPSDKVPTRLSYDFDEQGGASADTFVMGVLETKMVVTNAVLHVETAGASGGAAVVNVGYDASGGATADADAFVDNTNGAVAALTDDALVRQSAGEDIVLPAGTQITMTVATADLTAGRWHLWIEGYAAG